MMFLNAHEFPTDCYIVVEVLDSYVRVSYAKS